MPLTWTNVHGIDEAIAEAVRNDPYEQVGDISVTGLLRPPQMAQLEQQHAVGLAQDVSDGLWLLLGRAMHHVIAQARVAGSILEHRLTASVLGWTVSGTFDRWYDTGTLVDYKCTSVWSYIFGGRAEWQAQLNLYAYLARANNIPVNALKIVMLFRDWNKRQVVSGDNYPPLPFGDFEVALWPQDYTQRFLEERVALHQAARAGDSTPPCSDEERWARPDTWAVQKTGTKRAFRVFPSQFQASDFASRLSGYQVVHRKGQNIRCESYCPVVQWCRQARALGVTSGD